MPWNLKQLRDEVERRFGVQQRELLSPCLDSIVARKFYARFHFQEGMRLIQEFLKDRDDQRSLIPLILGAEMEEYDEFYVRRKQAEAHVVACMQSMHALSDTLGHVLYFASGQNLDPETQLDPRKVSIHSVRVALKRDPSAVALEKLVGILIDHSDYRYLADVVNHSKHRSVIGTSFTVNLTEDADQPYGLELRAFEHESRKYPKQRVESILTREYGRQAALIIQAGEALNRWVREKYV